MVPAMPTPTTRLDGNALNVLRRKDGHSLTSLAALSGYSVGYISDLESGRRLGNPGVIKTLAAALNVPMSMLERRVEKMAS